MAILKPSVIASISGRLGSVECSQTRAGNVAKRAKPHSRHTTPAQRQAQAHLARGITAWRALTDEQRRIWRRTAENRPLLNRLGLPRLISGFNLFMSVQWDLQGAPFSTIATVPPQMTCPPPDTVLLSFTAGGACTFFAYGVAPKSLTAYERIRIARFQPRTATKAARNWVPLGIFNHGFSPYDIAPAMAARGIVLLQGERVAIECTWIWLDYWPASPVVKFTTVV